MKKILDKTCKHIHNMGLTPYIVAMIVVFLACGGVEFTIRHLAPEELSVETYKEKILCASENTVSAWTIPALIVFVAASLVYVNDGDLIDCFKKPTGSDAKTRTEK
jgi:ABC-type molybdate transport system substrate-binding protein